jgi:NAD-dependent SIR2 family protein deacetylase
MSNIVFILGAGASKEAGAPIISDFIDKAEVLMDSGRIPEYVHDFRVVFDAIDKLKPVHFTAKLRTNNIEDVYATFEMAKLVKKLPGYNKNEEIENILKAIKILLSITLEKTVGFQYSTPPPNIHPIEYYHLFAQNLFAYMKKNVTDNKISIITFNYDLALDHALEYNLIDFDYGHTYPVSRDKIVYLKLHGSINWGRCSDCKKIYSVKFKEILNRQLFDIESSSQPPKLYPNIVNRFTNPPLFICQNCKKSITNGPIIVPPTWNKTRYHEEISEVWENAASVLSDADIIVISGYSLSEGDGFFRTLYALGAYDAPRIKLILVIDPNPETSDRIKNILGPGVAERYEHIGVKFSEGFQYIYKILRDY